MNDAGASQALGPELAAALDEKGYATLTPVQEAVLAPELEGRDLRISSQTGSGKTIAIGFVLRHVLARPPMPDGPSAQPRALVIVPTRELAKQVEQELAWLYARLGARVASVTGGSNYRLEHRALAANPAVVVGTPGRLLDHLDRGSIVASDLGAIVLDEADRMLDMGFQEDLERIFAFAPKDRRSHLVSATFPREVLGLANRVQSNPALIEATPLGEANADIEHVAHLVDAGKKFDALVNLLLAADGERTIVFGSTRADVAQVVDDLADAGFRVCALSGEMEQRERNRAIAAFKDGRVAVLVATDVAARGIDVQNVAQVIHLEPPKDADAYTHRSGRTGRAGNKGKSILLVARGEMLRAQRVARQSRVYIDVRPLPSADELRGAQADRIVASLTEAAEAEPALDPYTKAIVDRLIAAGGLERTVARLVAQSGLVRGPRPRDVVALPPPAPRQRAAATRERADGAADGVRAEGPRAPRSRAPAVDGWVTFHVTWGDTHGADARRMLAMVCRRGGIASSDIGRIDVGRYTSEVEVSRTVAAAFEAAAGKPDPRDRRVRITRARPETEAKRPARAPRGAAPARRPAPPKRGR